jgi:hypothetical protein
MSQPISSPKGQYPSNETEYEPTEYFQDKSWSPTRVGFCSDNNCPCPEVKIPPGQGYLYISPEIVDFRRQFRTDAVALAEMERRRDKAARDQPGAVVNWLVRIGPIMVCEQAAKLRGLDLGIAAEDAKRWWKTGKIPLRPTPLAKA